MPLVPSDDSGLMCNAAVNGTTPASGMPYGGGTSEEAGTCSCSSGSQQCSAGAGMPTPPAVQSVTTDILLNLTGRNVSNWLVKTWKPYHNTRSVSIL